MHSNGIWNFYVNTCAQSANPSPPWPSTFISFLGILSFWLSSKSCRSGPTRPTRSYARVSSARIIIYTHFSSARDVFLNLPVGLFNEKLPFSAQNTYWYDLFWYSPLKNVVRWIVFNNHKVASTSIQRA